MKKTILTLSLILLAAMSFAQEIQKGTDKKGKFVLEKNGKTIVKEKFEWMGDYDASAGLIPAKLNGKWGFYDNDGKLVIAHQYEILFFQNGELLKGWYTQDRMEVILNGKRFFIDKTGKEISAPEYESIVKAGQGSDAYYLKKDGKIALADKDKKPLTDFVYQIIQVKSLDPLTFTGVRDGKPYSINANGEEMGAAQTSNNNSNSTSTNKEEKCNYKCQKCNKTTQGKCNSSANGISVENCFAQQPDPKGPRKNHEWRKQ
jgi:hypothetical protein